MHLKQLILKGFKSFADRSVISLEPGITAVVGPNGSGKSNISDAVLWVLGERNAKNLRGQAMEDVIFAGSSARKSVGVAEVDLVLDNADGTLPVEFDEVSLTRRMYRNGESEYLINGAPARRMDFLDILHDTGLGTGTHSIIGQGNLDAILASKPEDRRTLIEEAAGVLKHKQRKDRSARKLALMDAHLARVKDVAAEVERQLKPLARKAQRAQAYQGVSEHLSQLELVLAVDDLRLLQKQWDAALTGEKEAAAGIDVCRLNAEAADEHLEKLQLALQEHGLYVGDLTAQRGRFHMASERLESVDRVLAERARTAQQRLDQAQDTAAGSTRRIAGFEGALADLREKHAEQQSRLSAASGEVESLQERSSQSKDVRKQADAQLADVQAALRTRERDIERITAQRSRLVDAVAGHAAAKNVLESKKSQAAEELALTAVELDEKCRGLEEETAALEALARQVRVAAEQVTQAEREQKQAQSAHDDARQKTQRLEGKIAALEEMTRSMRMKNAAAAWVSEHAAEFDEHIKPLAAEIHAPSEWEPLVEQLLGEDLLSLYVSDEHRAAVLAQALAASGARGEASVLFAHSASEECGEPAEALAEGLPPQALRVPDALAGRRLLGKLAYPPHLSAMLEALIGDVVLVESITEAFALHKQYGGLRYATMQGLVVWPEAKITVRTHEAGAEGALAHQRQLEALHCARDEALAQMARAQRTLEEATQRLEHARAESLELSRDHAQRRGAHTSAQAERERLAKRVGALEATLKALEHELSCALKELAETQPKIDELGKALEERRAARAQLEERAAVLGADRTAALEEEQKLSAQLNQAKLEYATAKERMASLERELREREQDVQRAQEAHKRAQRDMAAARLVLERIDPLRAVLASLKESAQEWTRDLAGKAALEQSNSATLSEAITQARQAARTAHEGMEAAQAQLNDVRVEKGRLEVQVEAAVSAIVHECGVPLETALETPAPSDRAAAEDEAFKLRRRLSNMGTIDSSAAEEYEAMKERYDFMASQVADVEAARASLKRIIDAIDARMQEQFDITFAQVNENFGEIFAQLFPGGKGSLELVGQDTPDKLGVEVHAQPRGKRITKMMLMSGGEKSLTALALLFAVYRIRRTPFFILDEVEAALDDSNLRRLTAYLETLRHETQLIMITHQRRTMEMSDVLYGVSMQADGVTKVVSQRLDGALARAHE